jgi:hypothetical protein
VTSPRSIEFFQSIVDSQRFNMPFFVRLHRTFNSSIIVNPFFVIFERVHRTFQPDHRPFFGNKSD